MLLSPCATCCVVLRRACFTPRQAPPLFSPPLRLLALSISQRIVSLSPSSPFLPDSFVLHRDLAFFLVQWLSGDRAGDLGRSVGKEVTRLPCGSLLFNHTVGKTIRQSDGDLLVVPAIPEEPLLCPVRALDTYVGLCKEHGVDVVNSFLFPPTVLPRHDRVARKPFTAHAATARLRDYLPEDLFPGFSLTAHGARAGCAITLRLLGASSAEVMAHCRWASDRVFRHYTKLEKVASLSGTARLLRDAVSLDVSGASSSDDAASFYQSLNSGVGQSRAF